MAASTTLITVLFTDLVGSTELLRRGAEVADAVRRAHMTSVRGAIDTFRGVEVKSTGDGIMATFSSAADAVDCAERIQQEAVRLRAGDDSNVPVRVGVACGEAVAEDGDWYGVPVIQAARLCALAEPDQVLVTSFVSGLLTGDGRHSFSETRPRELKGFDAPVGVGELLWQRTASHGVPLPPSAPRSGLFVGRGAELQQVEAIWKRARANECRLLLVAGEPGIGKTHLVGAFAALAHAHGALVLWGQCDDELGTGYQPFVEAFRTWYAAAPSDALGSVLEAAASGTESVRHSDRSALLPVDTEVQRRLFFDAVGELVDAAVATAPMVMVLDDLQWASRPTLLLLRHLIRRDRTHRLLVVATYRDTDVDRTHPLSAVLADFRRESTVERLTLRGLDRGGVLEYLEAATGGAVGDEGERLADLLFEETEGNAFFLNQVLRHLVETGALQKRDGRWTVEHGLDEIGIPQGVREVIGRRLSTLSDAANAAMAVGAVVGREFELRTLLEVPDAGESEDGILDALDEAVRARLVDEQETPGRYVFSHALVRHTVLSELTSARRARLHRRIGEALARRPNTDPGVVAHHFCAGVMAGGVAPAIEWSERAAHQARQRFAAEEGVALMERALQVLALEDDPDPRVAARLRLELADALQAIGDTARSKAVAAAAAEDARRAGDELLFADAAVRRASWGIAGVADQTTREVLIEALARLPHDQLAPRSRLLSAYALYQAVNEMDAEASAGSVAEAIDLARRSGDTLTLELALMTRAVSTSSGHDIEARRQILDEVARLGEQYTDEFDRVYNVVVTNREAVVLELQRGDVAASQAAIDTVLRTTPVTMSPFIPMWRGMHALLAGRFDEAEQHNVELAAAANDDSNFVNSWAAQLFRIRREQGRLAELLPLIEETVRATPGLVALRSLHALALADLGDLTGARSIFEDLSPGRFSAVPRDVTWSAALAELTDVCAALGDAAAADVLHEELLPYAGQLLVVAWGVSCPGAADRYLAMLAHTAGRLDEAAERYDAALDLEQRGGARPLVVRTRLWRARLFAATAPERLPSEARAVRDEAAALGMAKVVAEAGALLQIG